jgi:hypothetical protein
MLFLTCEGASVVRRVMLARKQLWLVFKVLKASRLLMLMLLELLGKDRVMILLILHAISLL